MSPHERGAEKRPGGVTNGRVDRVGWTGVTFSVPDTEFSVSWQCLGSVSAVTDRTLARH